MFGFQNVVLRMNVRTLIPEFSAWLRLETKRLLRILMQIQKPGPPRENASAWNCIVRDAPLLQCLFLACAYADSKIWRFARKCERLGLHFPHGCASKILLFCVSLCEFKICLFTWNCERLGLHFPHGCASKILLSCVSLCEFKNISFRMKLRTFGEKFPICPSILAALMQPGRRVNLRILDILLDLGTSREISNFSFNFGCAYATMATREFEHFVHSLGHWKNARNFQFFPRFWLRSCSHGDAWIRAFWAFSWI